MKVPTSTAFPWGWTSLSQRLGKNRPQSECCCWGLNAPGDVIKVVVTALSAKRVTGTFSGTLKPQPGKPATQDLVITDGKFDVGIP